MQTPSDLPKDFSKIDYASVPDEKGHFGPYGGRFVSETLIAALDELQAAYQSLKDDPAFLAEFDSDLAHYVGRPSPIYHAERWIFNRRGHLFSSRYSKYDCRLVAKS